MSIRSQSGYLQYHQDYKPLAWIVCFGPNRVSFRTDEPVLDIYGVPTHRKSQVYSALKHFFSVPASLTTIDRKTYAFKRRITSNVVSISAVKGPLVMHFVYL